MQRKQKTEKSGYCQRDNVEHEEYDRVHSASHGETNRQNGENLLERILERGNLILNKSLTDKELIELRYKDIYVKYQFIHLNY